MDKPTQWVGIDLHQGTLTVAVLEGFDQEVRHLEKMLNDPARIQRFFRRVGSQGPVRACYEASSCGFGLQRQLTAWGFPCEVIAPSLVPKLQGDRIKNDRRDAKRLARAYRSGDLTPVRIPTEAEERVRSLVRARFVLTREILASRHYILKLLQTRGCAYPGKSKWTLDYWRWLRGLELQDEDRLTLRIYLELLEGKLTMRNELEARLAELAEQAPWLDVVGRLRALRGIDVVTAMTLACEIGDVRRFANAPALMAWMGFGICENTSDNNRKQYRITKTGNARCRRVLVEAAWHYRHPPRVGKALAARQANQPEEVRKHSMRAQRRLHRRFKVLELKKASKHAVEWLIDHGHKRIVHFAGPMYSMHSDERIEGVRRAFSAQQLALTERDVVHAGARLEDGYAAGLAYFREKSDNPPTAVTCYNDLVAIGLMRALRELNIKVPDDVSVIGYDDIAMSSYCCVPLTSVRVPRKQIGNRAAEMLIQHIESSDTWKIERLSLKAELIVRESTRALTES